jgi:hypothetical protein
MVTAGLSAGRAASGLAVDDVLFTADTEVVAHTLIRGGVPDGMLPLTVVKHAVTELVAHNRGPGWHVAVRDVVVLRLFRRLATGDHLTTEVTCHEEPDDMLVAAARCVRRGLVIAAVTVRLAVLRDDAPGAEGGAE